MSLCLSKCHRCGVYIWRSGLISKWIDHMTCVVSWAYSGRYGLQFTSAARHEVFLALTSSGMIENCDIATFTRVEAFNTHLLRPQYESDIRTPHQHAGPRLHPKDPTVASLQQLQPLHQFHTLHFCIDTDSSAAQFPRGGKNKVRRMEKCLRSRERAWKVGSTYQNAIEVCNHGDRASRISQYLGKEVYMRPKTSLRVSLNKQ
jgi:hypothetical protein